MFATQRRNPLLTRTKLGAEQAFLPHRGTLSAAEANDFDAMVTGDKNMSYQQNLKGLRLALVILADTDWPTLKQHPAPIVRHWQKRCLEVSRPSPPCSRAAALQSQHPNPPRVRMPPCGSDLGSAFVLENEASRTEWLTLPESSLNLDWVPDSWWRLVTGTAKRGLVDRVHRRLFELCAFTQIMWDLKSGDAAIEGSREYADYRDQLISEDEATALSPAYQEQAGIPTVAKEFVAERRRWLSEIAQETERSFPENDAIRIENGEPVLSKVPRKKTPVRLPWLEATIRKEMPQTPILDALADTENLLHLDTLLRSPVRSGYQAREPGRTLRARLLLLWLQPWPEPDRPIRPRN